MSEKRDEILVLELTTAGGMGSGMERMESISIEGLAMLDALVADAIDGNFEPHVLLQEGIDVPMHSSLDARVHWHRVGIGNNVQDMIKDLAPRVRYYYIVAPEFGNYLEAYTALLESYDGILLSQPSTAVRAGSNKKDVMQQLAAAGIQVPPTQKMDEFITAPAIPYPVVVKPQRGAGSIGVFLARNETELQDAIAANERLSFSRDMMIVQEQVVGKQLSASAVASRRGTVLLGINEQNIVLSPARFSNSKYQGGIVGPMHPELAVECERVARAAAGAFHLEGYFGFDFILDKRGTPIVVELNPRLTTSFVGLKMVHRASLLRFIADHKGDKPVIPPWNPQNEFIAFKVITLPGHASNFACKHYRSVDLQVLQMRLPSGGISAFIAARGRTRTAAIESIGRLNTCLYGDKDKEIKKDRDVVGG
ncbi:MAG: ATP-grasp domain-containing protein [Candidatus Sigynarchaeota archaeon]